MILFALGFFFLPATESCTALLLGCTACCNPQTNLYSYHPAYSPPYYPYRAYSSYIPVIGAVPQYYANYAPSPAGPLTSSVYPSASQQPTPFHRHYYSRTNPLSYPNLVNSSYSIIPTYVKQLNAGYVRHEPQVLPVKVEPSVSLKNAVDSKLNQQLTNAITLESRVPSIPKEISEFIEEAIIASSTTIEPSSIDSTSSPEIITTASFNTNQIAEEEEDVETTTSFVFPEFTFDFPSITDVETTTPSQLAITISFIPEPKSNFGSFLTFFQNGELIGKELIKSEVSETRDNIDNLKPEGPEYVVDGGVGDGGEESTVFS